MDKPIDDIERQGNTLILRRGKCYTGIDLDKPSTFLYALTGYVREDIQDTCDQLRWELEKEGK